jgi:zinc protease
VSYFLICGFSLRLCRNIFLTIFFNLKGKQAMLFKRMTGFLLAVSLFLPLAAVAQNGKTAQNKQMSQGLNYEQYRLPNGLRVVLHQDKSTPIVAVNLWYHVGSKNETVGRTGFAHLFEHMMFQGSKHHDKDYFSPLQEAGASVNGSTNADRTNYYQVVPSNFLELALWLESDRMGYLLDAMTQEKLDNQRDVVKNEKRQRYDNVPYGLVGEKIASLMYPKEHPYSWLTIGSMEDLTAASMDDVQSFFRTYYVPNNATLVLAGDFETKEAKQLVEKYFAPIKKGADIKRPAPPAPKLDKEIRTAMEDAVALPRVYMVWHTVPEYDKDEAALDMLGSILSSGRGSRLQSNLVFGKQISQDIVASHFSREIAGQFQIVSTARPQKTLEEIEKEVAAEIERIKKEPPTAEEMERALNTREAAFIYSVQTVLGKADQLNAYATMRGEPNYFEQDLERYRKVTPADVQRVANQYLTDKKLVLTVSPKAGARGGFTPSASQGGTASIAEIQAAENAKKKKEPKAEANIAELAKKDPLYVQPAPKADPKFNLPKIEKTKLSNGLEVLFVKQSELPMISMNLVVKSGGTANPLDKAGLASMTAGLLNQGTKTRTASDISNQLQSIGAQLGAGAGWDSSSVSLVTLTKNLDKALDIFADVTVNPAFPESEMETQRRRLLVALLQQKDNANAIANVAYNALLYGKDHPYGNPLTGTESSVKAITRADVQKFYEDFYRPNNSALIVVGDADLKDLQPKLEKAFANWKPAEVKTNELPAAPTRDKTAVYIVDKPGAAQSVISIGQIGVPRDNPDYFPLQVMNSLLGGQFTSRVNMNLREEKGYTYGARTGFDFRKGAGPFSASAGVQTAVTKESVQEFLKELNGVRGAVPVTAKELEYNKQSLIRRYPSGFETVGQIGAQLSGLVIYGLPDTYFNDYISRINAVTVEDVNRVANKYLTPSKMAILVVGDRKVIEPKLREIENIEINFLDTEGQPLNVASK